MILLWGLRQDGPLSRAAAELDRRGAPLLFVDQRDVLDSGITLEVADGVSGLLTVGGAEVDLATVSAAYVRPYDSWRIGAVARAGRDSAEYRHAAAFDDCLWLWCELAEARVLNRPSAMAGNGSKPRQLLAIAAHGFDVPDTLVTTDPDTVRAFAAEHEKVIYKSVSGIRSIVSQLGPDDDRLEDVAWCPTQFQGYVPGDDYRVHVVGDQVFCSKIESAADDYRYASQQGADVVMTPADMPGDWPDRCRSLAADLGLMLAGIDLRRTPGGDWFCFEVNPSPAFSYYDRHGQGIAEAVARLLVGRAAF